MSVGISKQALGPLLRAHRKAYGLTISDLAGRAGVHRTTVSRWERGKVIPFIYELNRVLNVLEVSQKDRLACYKSMEAPRAIQLADVGRAAELPVSGGELLRALRQRARISQRAIALAANVAQSLVVKWENGECWPGNEHLHAFCYAVGATPDEMALLTTRAWRQTDPLPTDKDALDSAVKSVSDMPSPALSGVYLAFAARYYDLYRAGKISDLDAVAINGYYAHYIGCMLKRQNEARCIAAPVLANLARRRNKLSPGEVAAIDWQVEYGDAPHMNDLYACVKRRLTRHIENNLNLLDAFSSRFEPRSRGTLNYKIARTWERAGNVELAEKFYKRSLDVALSKEQAIHRSYGYVEFLCRHKRFPEAASHLQPASAWSWEKRPMVHIKNWCNYAEVLAGLGDFGEAESYFAQATAYANEHDLGELCEPDIRRVACILENAPKN